MQPTEHPTQVVKPWESRGRRTDGPTLPLAHTRPAVEALLGRCSPQQPRRVNLEDKLQSVYVLPLLWSAMLGRLHRLAASFSLVCFLNKLKGLETTFLSNDVWIHMRGHPYVHIYKTLRDKLQAINTALKSYSTRIPSQTLLEANQAGGTQPL